MLYKNVKRYVRHLRSRNDRIHIGKIPHNSRPNPFLPTNLVSSTRSIEKKKKKKKKKYIESTGKEIVEKSESLRDVESEIYPRLILAPSKNPVRE